MMSRMIDTQMEEDGIGLAIPSVPTGVVKVIRAQLMAVWSWALALRVLSVASGIVQLIVLWSTYPANARRLAVVALVVASVLAAAAAVANHPDRHSRDERYDLFGLATVFLMGPGLLIPSATLYLLSSLPTVAIAAERFGAWRAVVGTAGLVATLSSIPVEARWPGYTIPFILAISLLFTGAFALLRRWWNQTLKGLVDLMTEDTVQRQQLDSTFQRLLHDGLIAAMERAATGQPLKLEDRRYLAQLSNFARRELLGDRTPRSIASILDDAVLHAAAVGVALVLIEYIEDDPPRWVIEKFNDALGVLVSNLRHARIATARLAIDATAAGLVMTLVDEGVGRAAEAEWEDSVVRRVVEPFAARSFKATVLTAPEKGTTWRLEWHAE